MNQLKIFLVGIVLILLGCTNNNENKSEIFNTFLERDLYELNYVWESNIYPSTAPYTGSKNSFFSNIVYLAVSKTRKEVLDKIDNVILGNTVPTVNNYQEFCLSLIELNSLLNLLNYKYNMVYSIYEINEFHKAYFSKDIETLLKFKRDFIFQYCLAFVHYDHCYSQIMKNDSTQINRLKIKYSLSY